MDKTLHSSEAQEEQISMFLYSWEVEKIRNKKEFQDFCEYWTKEGYFETCPGSIHIKIKEENVDKLKEWLENSNFEYRLL